MTVATTTARLSAEARRTFSALSVRNFRLYFIGQLISVSGTWMQSLALGYLVVALTHNNGFDLGMVIALQFLPMLVAGSWAGLVIDRSSKRPVLYVTQGVAALLAAALGILVAADHLHVGLWQLYLIALLVGLVNMFDNPARQTFVGEMVGPALLPNAVSLNSVLMNASRVIGPAISAVVITAVSGHSDVSVGLSRCFFINAASYIAVIVALAMMHRDELQPLRRVRHEKGQLQAGFRYVWANPMLRNPLLAMTVVGLLAFNFTVTLLLFAKGSFHGTAQTVASFMVAMGIGAVIGGLSAARHGRPTAARLALLGFGFGASMVGVGLAPTPLVAMAFLVPMGAASIAFVATANGTLQLNSQEQMRGRVMSLYAIAFLGTTPIGAPLIGAISSWTSPRLAIEVGAVATLVASLWLWSTTSKAAVSA